VRPSDEEFTPGSAASRILGRIPTRTLPPGFVIRTQPAEKFGCGGEKAGDPHSVAFRFLPQRDGVPAGRRW
jgi:hypothetical protein